MAMSLSTPDGEEDDVIATINTTPLVDVMLVLLIIFLITIPVVTHTVPVKLPSETVAPVTVKPDNINIAIDRQGQIFWNAKIVERNELGPRLKTLSAQQPQPEVHIRGDQEARYEAVGRVVLMAQQSGITKVGFITQPPAQGTK